MARTTYKNKTRSIGLLYVKLLLGALPFVAVLALYFINDPFMVLRSYKRYDKPQMFLNEGMVGWRTYLNYRDSLHFDSFIMGNSCTMAFRTVEWEKFLDGGSAMRFFDNLECLGGACQKLQMLDMMKANIKNVLLVMDWNSFQNSEPPTGYLHVLPPEVSGINPVKYHFQYLQGFLYPNTLLPYLDYKLFNTYRSYMNGVINNYGTIRNPFTNDAINPRDELIEKEGERYWISHKHDFPPRNEEPKETNQVIYQAHLKALYTIRNICRKHGTNLKIVIGPNYKQVKMNSADLKQLQKVFGEGVVYDFSGANEYTADIHNFYEAGHYRPCLGNVIMKNIYQGTHAIDMAGSTQRGVKFKISN